MSGCKLGNTHHGLTAFWDSNATQHAILWWIYLDFRCKGPDSAGNMMGTKSLQKATASMDKGLKENKKNATKRRECVGKKQQTRTNADKMLEKKQEEPRTKGWKETRRTAHKRLDKKKWTCGHEAGKTEEKNVDKMDKMLEKTRRSAQKRREKKQWTCGHKAGKNKRKTWTKGFKNMKK